MSGESVPQDMGVNAFFQTDRGSVTTELFLNPAYAQTFTLIKQRLDKFYNEELPAESN